LKANIAGIVPLVALYKISLCQSEIQDGHHHRTYSQGSFHPKITYLNM